MSSFKLSRLDPENETQLLAAISELEQLQQIRCEESLTLLTVYLLLDGMYRSHGSAEQSDSTFDRLISKLRKLDVTRAALLLHLIAETVIVTSAGPRRRLNVNRSEETPLVPGAARAKRIAAVRPA